jgi:hypothetical protein
MHCFQQHFIPFFLFVCCVYFCQPANAQFSTKKVVFLAKELGHFVGAIEAKQKTREFVFLVLAVWKIDRIVMVDVCATDVTLHLNSKQVIIILGYAVSSKQVIIILGYLIIRFAYFF